MKATKETKVKVKLDIRPGTATPAQSQAWRKFFARLISECIKDLKTESEVKRER